VTDNLVGAQLAGLSLDLLQVEIARGHDGLLRGKPEPVLVVGVYLAPKTGVRLVKREIVRLPNPPVMPGNVQPDARRLARIRMGDADRGPVCIVVLGVEEDNGDDVARLYAALERPDAFAFWSERAGLEAPGHIAELFAAGEQIAHPRPMATWLDGHHIADTCQGDDWVGASVVVLPGEGRVHTDMRFHLVSADKKNDWTARARVRFRAA
jgi:hypothetical protein